MTTHTTTAAIVTSHGGDFFGEDRHQFKALTSLAGYAEGTLPAADRAPLVRLLQAPAAQTIPADEAEVLAELLLKMSRHRFLKGKPSALARSLADAAACAAAEGESWEWRAA